MTLSGISTTKLLSRLISDETIPQTNSNGKTKTLCLKSDMKCKSFIDADKNLCTVEYIQLVIKFYTLFRISQNDAKEKLCIAGPVTLLINEF